MDVPLLVAGGLGWNVVSGIQAFSKYLLVCDVRGSGISGACILRIWSGGFLGLDRCKDVMGCCCGVCTVRIEVSIAGN